MYKMACLPRTALRLYEVMKIKPLAGQANAPYLSRIHINHINQTNHSSDGKYFVFLWLESLKNRIMATVTTKRANTKKVVDARSRIKPRGLRGMFKGRIILNGTDEDVFSLNRLEKAQYE